MSTPAILELTSRWLRLWRKQGTGVWFPLVFQGRGPALPLALHYTGSWQVGWPAWDLYFTRPLEVLADFFASWQAKAVWRVGRRKVDARKLLSLILAELDKANAPFQGGAILLPSHWSGGQAQSFIAMWQQAASRPATGLAQDLVLSVAAWSKPDPYTSAIIADLDDYALMVTRVSHQDGSLVAEQRQAYPELGKRVWLKRLLAACAELAIHTNRQDPRLSNEACQVLHRNLEQALPHLREAGIHFRVHVPDFHGEFYLSAELAYQACAGLAYAAAQRISLQVNSPCRVFISWRLLELPGEILRALYSALRHRLPIGIVDEADYLRAAGRLVEQAHTLQTVSLLDWQQLSHLSLQAGPTHLEPEQTAAWTTQPGGRP